VKWGWMMRLTAIFDRLQKWDVSEVHLRSIKESSDRIRVENVIAFKRFVDDIAAIPAFKKPVQKLKQTAIYLASADQITIDSIIFKKIYKLHAKLFAYVEALKVAIGDDLGQPVDVRLSSSCPIRTIWNRCSKI
jgi:hypothetical protein